MQPGKKRNIWLYYYSLLYLISNFIFQLPSRSYNTVSPAAMFDCFPDTNWKTVKRKHTKHRVSNTKVRKDKPLCTSSCNTVTKMRYTERSELDD